MNKLVSVIIPVYNSEKYLRQCLDSVLAQDYRPIEVLAIDDGSTDNSAEIIKSYSEVKSFFRANSGDAVTRNFGLERAQGEYISFIDCDDYWEPNKLTLQINFLEANPECQFCIAHLKYFLTPGDSVPKWFDSKKYLLQGDYLDYGPGSLVARKNAFDIIGKFSEDFRLNCDVYWFGRAKNLKVPFGTLDNVLLNKRIHEANATALKNYQDELLHAIRDKIKMSKA